MALPWLQIVQLVPSIVAVSRELLKKNKRPDLNLDPQAPQPAGLLDARVAALEENERRQAELVSQIADQLSVLTKLVIELRSRIFWLSCALAATAVVAIVALFYPR